MFVSIPYHNNTTYVAIAHIVEIKPGGDNSCAVCTTKRDMPCTLSANELIRRITNIRNGAENNEEAARLETSKAQDIDTLTDLPIPKT